MKMRTSIKKYIAIKKFFSKNSHNEVKLNWFVQLIRDAFENSSFESPLVEEYYMEITIPYIKTTLKTSLLILITHIYLTILCVSLKIPNGIQSSIEQLIVLVILLTCLSLTLFVQTSKNFLRISMWATLIVIIQSLYSNYHLKSEIEIKYSPAIQIVVLVFTFIPLNFASSISISLLTISSLLFGTMVRISNANYTNPAIAKRNISVFEQIRMEKLLPVHFNMTTYLLGQILLWISAYLNSFYMFTCNHLWRRSAFLTLGENVQAKRTSKIATKGQFRWIEAIMPGVVKDEYWEHHLDAKADWVYIKTFDNVTILFADIVGFTKMSSNKTAPQVVTILNDLFNRFDELCNITNCEKLGTLGDCYYCVAGCPIPRPDHAVSCIEMGLGMCRIIKQFNVYHKSDVNMRVGIHTGRVNAAILGRQRFRFDVYSNDVIIANTMESSGLPGRVHISQQVYDIIRHAYNVNPGDDLEIKREEDHGIAGMLLKSTFIKTYFVDPKSSHLKQKDEQFGKRIDFHVLDVKEDNEDYDSEMSFENMNSVEDDGANTEMTSHKKTYMAKIDKGVAFIETLRYDTDQQINCLRDPPINMITLNFYDPEVEWHFQSHTFDHIQRFTLYSAKLAPLVECIVSLVCTLFILCASFVFFFDDTKALNNSLEVCSLIGMTIALMIIEFWKASTYYSLLQKRYERYFYICLTHAIYRSFVCVFMTMLPNIMCFILVYDCSTYSNDYYFQARYFSLNLFSLLNGSLFISTWSWVKILVLIFNFCQSIYFGCLFDCDKTFKLQPVRPYYSCLGIFGLNIKHYQDVQLNEYFFQYLFTFIILVVLIRERERNLRIWFYVSREAEIGREEALQAMNSSQELLYNIIPKYVFDYIALKGTDQFEIGKFNYALAVPKAGVIFASISNFFSTYYREDYKSGGNALKLLHNIITKFDNILLNKEYKDLEKIKTINDCYMLASGLNSASVEINANNDDHLISLLNYAFDMQKALDKFNEFYIIGADKFEIKIGYNYGPVTAGIIGSTKPMYDIWGDTVNVASRMYSTGKPGEIQVPHYVASDLENYFEFVYRDNIFVKGKGNMNTYLCLKPIKI